MVNSPTFFRLANTWKGQSLVFLWMTQTSFVAAQWQCIIVDIRMREPAATPTTWLAAKLGGGDEAKFTGEATSHTRPTAFSVLWREGNVTARKPRKLAISQ